MTKKNLTVRDNGHENMHFFLINVGKKGVQGILIL